MPVRCRYDVPVDAGFRGHGEDGVVVPDFVGGHANREHGKNDMTGRRRKRVSIRDVARSVGVDPSTVSLALNGSPRVAEKTRARVIAAATEMGYQPNALAQALRRGRTHSAGLLAASLDIPFFVDLLKAQERWLVSHDYSVLFANLHGGQTAVEERVLLEMRMRGVEGLCIGFPNESCREPYEALVAAGIPLSFYVEKEHLSCLAEIGANAAVCDLSRGCYALLEYLVALGHRRIAYIGYVDDRERDYFQAMKELGLPVEPGWVQDTSKTPDAVEAACAALAHLRPRPTAIFTQSDEYAAEILNGLVRHGIQCPRDMSVVGINNTRLAELVRVPLTTLALPTEDIGAWMAEVVIRQAEVPGTQAEVRYFPTRIVERESAAPPPAEDGATGG